MTDAAADIRPSGRRPGGLAAIVTFGALVVLAGLVLFPVLATALNGFKDLSELRTNPFGLPHVWMWSNYWSILTGARYWQVLGNSLLIALFTVALTLIVSSMAAFTFAHLRFFGDKFLLSYIQLGLLFPVATAIVPLFIKIRDLGLLDSYWGVILPQVAFSLAMSVLLIRNAFKQLPSELLDAAMMDGCGYFRYFIYVPATLRPDPVDSRGHLLCRQLERLSPAAHRPQQRVALPLDARPHGLPGPVHDLLAACAGLHYPDHFAGDHHVSHGAALYRRRSDRGRDQGVSGARRRRSGRFLGETVDDGRDGGFRPIVFVERQRRAIAGKE